MKLIFVGISLTLMTIIFVILFQNTVILQIGCSARDVRVTGVTVRDYKTRSIGLFGNTFSTFEAGADDGPDILFTRIDNGRIERYGLGYVSVGAMGHYYIPCR